jgi:CBS domain containing-hemolysin-like protein
MTTRTGAFRGLAIMAVAALTAPPSFAASAFVDTAATYLAIFIIIAVPIGGIALFWLVHILPEKIAEKNHHPQAHAIKTLCLLSLVFGGLLWPLAWLWAYTKPVFHKMAYGRDKSDDYYLEGATVGGTKAEFLSLHEELGHLRHELESLEKQGVAADALQTIRDRVARLERRTLSDTVEAAR